MSDWALGLFVFGAVAVAMLSAGWAAFLDHQRRMRTLDLIKTILAAGKEPPQQLYDQLAQGNTGGLQANSDRWAEVFVFASLAFGFWLAFALIDGPPRTAFFVVAASMTVTALGCLVFALRRRAQRNLMRDDERQ